MNNLEEAPVITNTMITLLVVLSAISMAIGFSYVYFSDISDRENEIYKLTITVEKVADYHPSKERTAYLKAVGELVSQESFNKWDLKYLESKYTKATKAAADDEYHKEKERLKQKINNSLNEA